jgi:hypothetical protein
VSPIGRKALEILQDIADQLGWAQPTTLENAAQLAKDQRKLIRAFNRVLRAMSTINDWHFLRAEGEIELVASYETGLMRLTNGSTSVTGQNDADGNPPVWSSDHVGRAVLLDGHPVVYRIASVEGATSLTLTREFVGTTSDGGTTKDDYINKIVQDRFDLPLDFDRPVQDRWTRFDGTSSSKIGIVTPEEVVRRRRARNTLDSGDPEVVTLWRQDDVGEHRVAVFDKYPDTQRLVTFEYQKQHPLIDSDTQRILFSQREEEMILAGVEFLLLRGPEDDQRAQFMLAEFLQQQYLAVSKSEIGTQRTRLSASREHILRQHFRHKRKGRRTDWGKYFDRAGWYELGRY